jgi:hypothetical protein
MTQAEANKLVNKSMKVILSCKNLDQLHIAVKYADLVYRKLAQGVGLVNNTQFICLTERAIGYTQCQIKYTLKPLTEE